jgi:Fibronectin type III domain
MKHYKSLQQGYRFLVAHKLVSFVALALIVFSGLAGSLAAWQGWAVKAASSGSTTPDTPVVTTVVAVGLGLLVSWNPDAAGEQVSVYNVTAVPAAGGVTPPPGCAGPFTVSVDGSNSAALVGGLCTGVAYTATASATNSAGSSASSPPSSPVVPLPAQVPEPPVIGSVMGRDSGLIVSWSPPAMDGGKPITAYKLTAAAGSSKVTVHATASATSATIGGLINGTSYNVSVVAVNAVGASPAAKGSGIPKPAYVPGGPGQVSASPDGSGDVAVSWAPPVDDGGSAISGFTLTWQQVVPGPGGTYIPAPGTTPGTATAGSSATTLTIPAGSFNPAAALYAIKVAAVNAVGTGTATATVNPVTPVTSVSSATVVLTTATMAALGSDTPASSGGSSVLSWPAPAPTQVTQLVAGKVLVAAPAPAAPNGLMDTVSSVSTDSAGNYAVTVAPASLDSVFSTLALASTSNPLTAGSAASGSPAAPNRFRPSVPGVRNLVSAGPNAAVDFNTTLTLGVNLKLTAKFGANATAGGFITGQIAVQPDVSLSLNLDHGLAGIPNGVAMTAATVVKVTDSLRAGIQGQWSQPIGEISSAPIDIQAGIVPVIVVPKVLFLVTASGQIGVSFSATATIGASMAWNSNNPNHLGVTNLSVPPHLTGGPIPGLSGTGQLNVGFTAQPELQIYDQAGPDIEANLMAATQMTVPPPAGQPWLTITPQLQLKAGFQVDILEGRFTASLQVTLATQLFKPFTLFGPSPVTLTINPVNADVSPGQTIQFSSSRSDGTTGHPVTWTLGQAAGDTITRGGLFTAINPPGRTVTIYATDDTGATGQTTVTIGTPFDPVSGLTASQDASDLGAQVSWTAPANTGGSPLADYLVTVSGGVPSQSTSGTSVALQGLRAGVTYAIIVSPINTAGQTGPAASTTLLVIPLCTDAFTGGPYNTDTAWNTAANWSAGRVPNSADWVCTNGLDITLPSARVTVQGLQQLSGTLTIPSGGTLTVTNTASAGGALAGPGTVLVPAGSVLTLDGTFGLGGVRLLNKGTTEVGALTNGCYFGQGFTGGSVLENAATLILDDGANLGLCSDGNAANQVVNDAGATISYKGGSSGATVSVGVTDSGTITIGAGRLTVSALTFTGSATTIGIGVSGSSNGMLAVNGNLTLTGTLAITTAGNYTPPLGTQLTVVSAGAISGTFAVVTGAELTNEHWAVSYTSTAVVLTAAAGQVPQASR